MPKPSVEYDPSAPWASLFNLVREGQEELRRLIFYNTVLLAAIAALLGVKLGVP